MKTSKVKLIVVTGLVALASALVVPVARASDEKPDASARKPRPLSDSARKYDANHDGKLDDAEKAVRKADKEKARAEREIRKRDRAEREAQQETEEGK